MAKYINKDALLAEIEKEIKCIYAGREYVGIPSNEENIIIGIQKVEDIINTLEVEVKEVDLDFTKEVDVWIDNNGDTNGFFNVQELAKHFFELGMAVRTDKELVKEVYSHIDSIKDTADRMTSGNFMHNRAAIKFSANTIAKVLELMGLKVQKGE